VADITTMSFYYSGVGTAAGSIGGAFSGIAIPNNIKQNLFPNVSTAQAGQGLRQYRCIYLRAGNYTYSDLKLFLTGIGTPSPDSQIFIGLGVAAVNNAEPAVANETLAPNDVVFTLPTDELDALVVPDMPALSYKSIWVQRVVNGNAQGYLNDYVRMKLVGTQR
jgi:hypothetical protein